MACDPILASRASAGGQLEHRSEVNSSTRTGEARPGRGLSTADANFKLTSPIMQSNDGMTTHFDSVQSDSQMFIFKICHCEPRSWENHGGHNGLSLSTCGYGNSPNTATPFGVPTYTFPLTI